MKRGGPLKRAPLKRRRPWRAGVRGDRELRNAFVERVLRDAGYRCARADADCAGPLDAHHVTPKAAIKGHARARGATSGVIAALLWDPENGICLCRRHHDLHETAANRVPRELLPERALAFAARLNLSRLIDRSYPATEHNSPATAHEGDRP